MTPLTVFVRTLMKSSAICLGIAFAVTHPGLDGVNVRPTAQKSVTETAVDELVTALKDSDAGVRIYAAAALGQLRNARAVPGLIAASRDEHAEVRLRAVGALGQMKDARAVPALIAALKDADPRVRARAASSLADLRDASAIDHRTVAVHDE